MKSGNKFQIYLQISSNKKEHEYKLKMQYAKKGKIRNPFINVKNVIRNMQSCHKLTKLTV